MGTAEQLKTQVAKELAALSKVQLTILGSKARFLRTTGAKHPQFRFQKMGMLNGQWQGDFLWTSATPKGENLRGEVGVG